MSEMSKFPNRIWERFSHERYQNVARRYTFHARTSTTTVVMKVHETLDERVSGARVVGNGCDVPRTASSFGISTRPASPQANGPVTAAQSPTSGAPRARSPRQAHRLQNFFSLLPALDARQPRMSHHPERHVPIPPV